VGSNDIAVDGKKHTAKKIVIATGSRPRTLELYIRKGNWFKKETILGRKHFSSKSRRTNSRIDSSQYRKTIYQNNSQ
jgi:pyruvate/2-oxoglutarate dehydrogenase complex dihydrolipoamide dehydrogenase (E3) component